MTDKVATHFTVTRNTIWVAKMDQWLPAGEWPGYSVYGLVRLEGNESRRRVKARIVLDTESLRQLGWAAELVGEELNVMASLMAGSASAREDDSN